MMARRERSVEVNRSEIMGTDQKGLTNFYHMINLPYDNSERSTHDGRSTPSTTQRPWMEPLLPHGLQQEILLRSEVEDGGNLHRSCLKARAGDRKPSARQASQGEINKASVGWPP